MSNTIQSAVRVETPRHTYIRSGVNETDARPRPVVSGRTVYGSLELTEEALIVDTRAALRPAQAVERRLVALLDGTAISVSHLRLASLSSRNRVAQD